MACSLTTELEFHVKCTKSGSCADGLGVGWFDTAAVAVLTPAMANIGGAQGVVAPIGVDFRAAWHELAISVRGSAVTVVYDCAP